MKMRLQSVWHVASISIRVYARTCILLAIVSRSFCAACILPYAASVRITLSDTVIKTVLPSLRQSSDKIGMPC